MRLFSSVNVKLNAITFTTYTHIRYYILYLVSTWNCSFENDRRFMFARQSSKVVVISGLGDLFLWVSLWFPRTEIPITKSFLLIEDVYGMNVVFSAVWL